MLLEPNYFEPIFKPFIGKRIGYVQMYGNSGDRLIDAATAQLFDYFSIEYVFYPIGSNYNNTDTSIDEYVIAGGGNMGSYYPPCRDIRSELLTLGKPVTILPQSFTSEEDTSRYKKVWIRETGSYRYSNNANANNIALGPDLALFYLPPYFFDPPSEDIGIYLRRDLEETRDNHILSSGDPVLHPSGNRQRTVEEYLRLLAYYKHIITNRLHFAIAALITRRKVTLLPNSYHKNISMYDTWLHDLGCNWANTVEEALKEI